MKLSRPRLWQPPVYADEADRRRLAARLEAKGDPRGRFVAVQLELARCGPTRTAETYELVCEERRLLSSYEEAWSAELGLEPHELRWFRGSPEVLSLSWPRFLSRGPALLSSASPRGLALTSGDDAQDIGALARCPGLDALKHLALGRVTTEEAELLARSPLSWLREIELQTSGAGFSALARSPSLRGLRSLRARAVALTATDVRALVAAPWFRNLETFSFAQLWDCQAGNIVTRALCDSRYPPRLQALELGYNELDGADVAALAAWPGLSAVEELDLEGNQLHDRDVATLLDSPHLGSLRGLRLGPDRLGAGTLRTLAAWPGLGRLTTLAVRGEHDDGDTAQLVALSQTSSFGDFRRLEWRGPLVPATLEPLASWASLARFEALSLWGRKRYPDPRQENAGLAALARSPYLTQLRSLEIHAAVIDARALAALLASPSLENLHHLAVLDCAVGDAGARAIAQWPGATQLETLQLANASLSSRGARALAESALLPRLRGLSLRGNAIGASGAAALATPRGLDRLHILGLDRNAVGDRGACSLARSASWPRLRFLGLCGNRIGDAGAASLWRASAPGGPHLTLEDNTLGEALEQRLRTPGLPIYLGPRAQEARYFEALGFDEACS